MLVLKPITHNTIWGGPRISGIAGVKGERIGHLYSVFCREWVSNTILNGERRGKHLNDVFPFWKDKAIAEIELREENAEIRFPDEIKVIREVTYDESYKNASLAKI